MQLVVHLIQVFDRIKCVSTHISLIYHALCKTLNIDSKPKTKSLEC